MNAKLAHTLYGEPASRGSRPAGSTPNSRLAPPSSPYLGRQRCIANEDTCEGPQAKGTEYCIGHLRAKQSGKDV